MSLDVDVGSLSSTLQCKWAQQHTVSQHGERAWIWPGAAAAGPLPLTPALTWDQRPSAAEACFDPHTSQGCWETHATVKRERNVPLHSSAV